MKKGLKVLSTAGLAAVFAASVAIPTQAAVIDRVLEDTAGTVYQYDEAALGKSYTAFIVGEDSKGAALYKHYLNNIKNNPNAFVAFNDDKAGYVTYESVQKAFNKSVVAGEDFNLDIYTESGEGVTTEVKNYVNVTVGEDGSIVETPVAPPVEKVAVESVMAINETTVELTFDDASEIKDKDLTDKELTLTAGENTLTATYKDGSLLDGKAVFLLSEDSKIVADTTYTVSADWATFVNSEFTFIDNDVDTDNQEKIDAAVKAAQEAINALPAQEDINANNYVDVQKSIKEAQDLLKTAQELDENVVFNTYPLDQAKEKVAEVIASIQGPIDAAVKAAQDAIYKLPETITKENIQEVRDSIKDAKALIETALSLDENVVFNTYPLDQLQQKLDTVDEATLAISKIGNPADFTLDTLEGEEGDAAKVANAADKVAAVTGLSIDVSAIGNYDHFEFAQERIKKLKEDMTASEQAAMDARSALINLPIAKNITLNDKKQVENARAAYDKAIAFENLDESDFVNYWKLDEAEKKIKALEQAANEEMSAIAEGITNLFDADGNVVANLNQETVSSLQKRLNATGYDTVEDAQLLQQNLDKAQEVLDIKSDVSALINEDGDLAAGVNQETINDLRERLRNAAYDDTADNLDIVVWLGTAQEKYDEKLAESNAEMSAIAEGITNLIDEDGNLAAGVDQATIDDLQDRLNATAYDTEADDQLLQEKLDTAQDLLNKQQAADNVSDKEQLDQAIENGVTRITLTDDFKATGHVIIDSPKLKELNLNGVITGDLTVNAPNATVVNNATVTGTINIGEPDASRARALAAIEEENTISWTEQATTNEISVNTPVTLTVTGNIAALALNKPTTLVVADEVTLKATVVVTADSDIVSKTPVKAKVAEGTKVTVKEKVEEDGVVVVGTGSDEAVDLEQAAKDKAAAEAVTTKIGTLPADKDILENGKSIAETQEAFGNLTPEQKALVSVEDQRKLADTAKNFVSYAKADISGLNEAVAKAESVEAKAALVKTATDNLAYAKTLGLTGGEYDQVANQVAEAQKQVDTAKAKASKEAVKALNLKWVTDADTTLEAVKTAIANADIDGATAKVEDNEVVVTIQFGEAVETVKIVAATEITPDATATVEYIANGNVTVISNDKVTFADGKFTIKGDVTQFTFKDGAAAVTATYSGEKWGFSQDILEQTPAKSYKVVYSNEVNASEEAKAALKGNKDVKVSQKLGDITVTGQLNYAEVKQSKGHFVGFQIDKPNDKVLNNANVQIYFDGKWHADKLEGSKLEIFQQINDDLHSNGRNYQINWNNEQNLDEAVSYNFDFSGLTLNPEEVVVDPFFITATSSASINSAATITIEQTEYTATVATESDSVVKITFDNVDGKAFDASKLGETFEVVVGDQTYTAIKDAEAWTLLTADEVVAKFLEDIKVEGATVTLSSSLKLNVPVTPAKNVTIDGAGNTLTLNAPSLGNTTADGLFIQNDNVTIKNLKVTQTGDSNTDNLIEIYGTNASLVNVGVTNSKKNGIYVNNDGKGAMTVTFSQMQTANNTWAGVGLVAQKSGDSIAATFNGTNSFGEDTQVYADIENYQDTVVVTGLTAQPNKGTQKVWATN